MERLLEPLTIGALRFKNRMVHVPTTMNMSDPTGHVTDKLIGAYESIAAGGSAATIVGATCVRWDGLINERMLGLYDDTYVIGYRDLVDVIRNNGSLSGIQLFYGGMIPGLGTTTPLDEARGWIPNTVAWGPSNAVAIGNAKPAIVPTEVYDSLVEDFAHAARRAREAGFDFVSYHFCHGSLPHTNLSLLANVGRNDEYADHFRFCEKILLRTQELCGKEFPLIPRLCCDEILKGGYDIEYFAEHFAPRLHEIGIAALDCTFGSMVGLSPGVESRDPKVHSTEYIGPGFYTPNAVNLSNIAELRRRLIEKNIDMPLIGSSNLCTPDELRKMVTDGHADLAGSCRLSMDDPEYANKIYEGREDEIRKSTKTGASLLQGNIFGKGWAGSAQNAAFGRDREYRIRHTGAPKKVVVVGGGSGGLEYAITAKQIGHEVVVFEKSNTLGGTMDWAGNYQKIPNMDIIRYQPDYHRVMTDKLKIPYHLGTEAHAADILAEKPDVVVVATGAKWIVPQAEGLEAALASGFAVMIDKAMARDGDFDPGETPIIYGAGIGGELAVDYAMRGLKVRLLDESKVYRPVNYLGSRGPRVQMALAQHGLAPELGLTLARVGAGYIEVKDADGKSATINASKLILSTGRQPANDLVEELQGTGVTLHVVGDARVPRSYGNAIHEAAYLSRRI